MDGSSFSEAATPRQGHPRASDLLGELADAFPDERVTVGEVLDRLDGRAYGLLLLLLAAPNCIPNIPGISTIFGVMLIAPSIQMIFGRGKLWLPRRMRAWEFQRSHLRMAIHGAVPILKRIERFVQPRWSWAVRPPFTAYLGLQTLYLAFVLILPIPLGNFGPGLVVAATALALLQEDGRLAILTPILTVIASAVAWVGIQLGLAAVQKGWDLLLGAFGM
ncbi:MAG: exopolysaccharide biosynthesis protein [Alphaproteobacteria bacterium]|nr:exopolysaccharide biosynthesis protein [Alphaproteobacteria bacterium]